MPKFTNVHHGTYELITTCLHVLEVSFYARSVHVFAFLTALR